MPPRKISLKDKLASFGETWTPKLIAELNGQHVKLAKIQGEYVWHHHADEDELFLVISGSLEMHLRDGVIEMAPGELIVIPRGVEHKPVARQLTEVLLFEPASTRSTGNVTDKRTVEPDGLEWI